MGMIAPKDLIYARFESAYEELLDKEELLRCFTTAYAIGDDVSLEELDAVFETVVEDLTEIRKLAIEMKKEYEKL